MKKYKPVVLVILDGWGIGKPVDGNAIWLAKTPAIRRLIRNFPGTTLQAAGGGVGLPWLEMGNSEVGHLNLGSGRIVLQDLPRINKAIEDGSFFANPAFLQAIEHIKKNNSHLHLMGLVSPGGVHSHQDHLYALLDLAQRKGVKQVYIHAFLDGRDTEPQSGLSYLKELEQQINSLGIGRIATICGRFFAMDRDKHWERIQKAYETMVQGKGNKVTRFYEEIEDNYKRNIYDEYIEPMVIVDSEGEPQAVIRENDSVIFFNYRADRAREITRAFLEPRFSEFPRGNQIKNLFFVAMAPYEKDLPYPVAFPEEELKMTLAEVVSRANLKQLHIAETEKYTHVTRFFNGDRESPFPGEDQILIPSPRVENYAQVPEMSASQVASRVISEIQKDQYDFILVNFANPDMVGHTGNIEAAVRAVEVVDECLGKICELVLAKNGALVVTADHGNAEEMLNPQTGMVDTEHSKNPVPLIVAACDFQGKGRVRGTLHQDGEATPVGFISDIAPTVLALLGLPKPSEMTGMDLLDVLLKKKS